MAGEYVDVEHLLVAWLQAEAEVQTLTELPADIAEPVLQVFAFGGSAENALVDSVNVDVDAYWPADIQTGEPDVGAAQDLAQTVRYLMLRQLPGYTGTVGPVAGTVLTVQEISRPVRRPYDESGIRRVHASYRVRIASRG